MKQSIFIQILILILILFGWNIFHLGYNYQQDFYHSQLSEKPLILVSPHSAVFNALQAKIDTFHSVDFVVVETDSMIAAMLIENYDLGNASALIGNFELPSIMKIYLNGEYYNIHQKSALEKIISAEYPEIVMNYDDNYWHNAQSQKNILARVYLIGNVFIIIFLIIISVFLRLHFESKSNEYWWIFKKSGGNPRLRKKKFWTNSLLLSIIPILFTTAVYFGLRYFNFLPVTMKIKYFAGEFAVIMLSVFISRIALGKKI